MNTPTQLTIEHLAAYLPYGVDKITRHSLPGVGDYQSKLMCGDLCIISKEMRLILRPLSQLTEQITHNGETFVPMDRIKSEMPYSIEIMLSSVSEINPNDTPYGIVTRCLSWHFDVFGLIEAGLAVSMNPDGTIAQ